MAASWLRGVFPPIPTAFCSDGGLGTPLDGYLLHLRDSGLDGVVALGSNGEAAQLTESERLVWLATLRKRLPPPLKLIAGTGAQSTHATIELTRAAADVGAEAALVITPSYYRRDLTSEALRSHFETVAERSPIPILLYNVPFHTGLDVSSEWLQEIAGHPNLVGMKDSSGDPARISGLRARLPADFVILVGTGERMAEALATGADGAVAALANLAPRECAEVRRAMLAGDADGAGQLQARIAPIGEALTRRFGVRGVKSGLRIQGFDHGPPRPPVPPLSEQDEADLHRLLEAADLLPRPVRP